ncbi:MAG: 3-mercaptopyruvate sulfurtransferase [Gammaproteobacteria bacterium]
MNDSTSPLISADQLVSDLHAPDIVILDATFFLPNQSRNGETEFQKEHIPGARFFDIDRIADRESPLPHMLPSADQFAESAGSLGIDQDSRVVVYDNNSFLASARVWWTFRVFGHERVAVLDGGLKRWKSLNLPLEAGTASVPMRQYRAAYQAELVCNFEEVLLSLDKADTQILDARSASRFAGTEAEPRPGLRSGHIPRSLSLPFTEVLDTQSGCLKPVDEIADRFNKLGLRLDLPVVASCGSGVTAAILALALYRIGKKDTAVYDGSWSEWGARSDAPVERSN